VVAPKRAALAEANKRLDGANKKLTGIRAKVKELKDRVASLEDSLMKVSHQGQAIVHCSPFSLTDHQILTNMCKVLSRNTHFQSAYCPDDSTGCVWPPAAAVGLNTLLTASS